MNILYCGDKNIIDGLIISILSLLKNTTVPLNIYVLTMKYSNKDKTYDRIPDKYITMLDSLVKKTNKDSSCRLIDITDIVLQCLPTANIDTRFTPYCMLRLYADQIEDLPSKILYLDNDIVCLKDPTSLYEIDNTKYEIVGVLDYYGKHVFHKKLYRNDYLNSGVLLLNLDLIRKTKLFLKARKKCQRVKMLMPDQTAINMIAKKKFIINRRYNEQHRIKKDTILRHYTTTFKFWPKVTTQTIKPWHIDKLHDILNDHEFDDILEKYQDIMKEINNE